MTSSVRQRCFFSAFAARLVQGWAVLCLIVILAGCSSQQSAYHHKGHRHHVSPGKAPDSKTICVVDWDKAPPLPPDVWDRIQSNYRLKYSPNNPRIVTERDWYAKHQAYLNRTSGRSARYIYHIANELEKRNLPGELALLPIVESAYNPFAYSRSRASGLWQFVPGTAKHLKMDMNWWYDQRRDVPGATKFALDYLVFLRDHYNGDWLKALAAYNAGWGTIDKAVARNEAKGLPTDYWSLDVPDETSAYVPKLLALAEITKDPDAYGVHWAYIPDLPYFSTVTLNEPLDINHAADIAGIDKDELFLLNPGLNRCVTPPRTAHQLLVPVDHADALQTRLIALKNCGRLPRPNQISDLTAPNPNVKAMEEKAALNVLNAKNVSRATRSYKVQGGDTLGGVARKHKMDVDQLRKINNLASNDALHVGSTLALSTHTPTSVKSSRVQRSASKQQVVVRRAPIASVAQAGKKSSATSTARTIGKAKQTVVASKAFPGKKAAQSRVAAKNARGTAKTRAGKTKKSKTAYTVRRADTLTGNARPHQLDTVGVVRRNAIDKEV